LLDRFDSRSNTEGAQISASQLGSQCSFGISGIATVTPTAVHTTTRLGAHPLSPVPEQTWYYYGSAVFEFSDTTVDDVPAIDIQHHRAVASSCGWQTDAADAVLGTPGIISTPSTTGFQPVSTAIRPATDAGHGNDGADLKIPVGDASTAAPGHPGVVPSGAVGTTSEAVF